MFVKASIEKIQQRYNSFSSDTFDFSSESATIKKQEKVSEKVALSDGERLCFRCIIARTMR